MLRHKARLANVSPWLFWGPWVQHRVPVPCLQQPWDRRAEILREYSLALVDTGSPNTSPVEPCFCRTTLGLRTFWMPGEKPLAELQTLQRREGVKRYGECWVGAQPLGHHSLSSSATQGPDIPHMEQEHGSGGLSLT